MDNVFVSFLPFGFISLTNLHPLCFATVLCFDLFDQGLEVPIVYVEYYGLYGLALRGLVWLWVFLRCLFCFVYYY